jgi:hypothetical protein
MKKLHLPILILIYLVPGISFADPIDKIAGLIKQGNVQELSKQFAPNVEISLLGNENVYSQTQAEIILDKFFSQNKPQSVKTLHKVNSNPKYLFGVLLVSTDKGPYRVTFTLKQTDSNFTIVEFRVEVEKAQ